MAETADLTQPNPPKKKRAARVSRENVSAESIRLARLSLARGGWHSHEDVWANVREIYRQQGRPWN